MTDALPRSLRDVGLIVGAELDTMTAVFSDICWEVYPDQMAATFVCDGKLYMLTVAECPDDVKAELGYPVPDRSYCWHCEERIIGSGDRGDSKHPTCNQCPTWEAGCMSEDCEACR